MHEKCREFLRPNLVCTRFKRLRDRPEMVFFAVAICSEGFFSRIGTARAARGCQVPFSVLRMLTQATPNRRQKSENGTRPPKPPPCDINATSKPPQCVLLA